MPAGKKIDWITLRAEFVMSDPKEVPDRTTFFRKKGITDPTWKRKALADWDEERTAHIREAARLAVAEHLGERKDFIREKLKAGEIVEKVGMKALEEKDAKGESKLVPKTAKEAAELVKMGLDIQTEAIQLEQTPEMQAMLTLNLQVNQQINQEVAFEGIDSKTLRSMAKRLGRAKAGVGDVRPFDMGNGKH